MNNILANTNSIQKLVNKRPIQIGLLVLGTVFAAYSVNVLINLNRQMNVKGLMKHMAASATILEKSPLGTERLENFVTNLKSAKTSGLPDDVKAALSDYINSLQVGLEAYKSGTNHQSEDQSIQLKKAQLLSTIKKYTDCY